MKQEDLQIIQQNIFVLFKQFDRICKQNNFRYYLLGGTMLGAVRHKGFIPWDDDVDVGMPRKDYEELLKLCDKGLWAEQEISVFNAERDSRCSYDFTKLMRKYLLNGKEIEIFVDIFPLDGCPGSSEKSIRRYYKVFNILRTMKNTHYMKLEGKSAIKRVAVRVMRLIPRKTYIKWMKKYLERNSFDASISVGNFSGHWQEREIMSHDIYGTPTPIFFVDGEYLGIEKADAYLTRMYGDYMKLPSEEERLSHFID